jgi:hypothetical protein
MTTPDVAPALADPVLTLEAIEARADRRGLLLRLRAPRRLGVWGLQVVVARPRPGRSPLLLGELKGWAIPTAAGLRLDTLRVQGEGSHGVGALIWAATFAWALEATPCRRARLLAISDAPEQHRRLVRYFERLGFRAERELGAGPLDLGPRLLWGGSGLLMEGDCAGGLRRCARWLGTRPAVG